MISPKLLHAHVAPAIRIAGDFAARLSSSIPTGTRPALLYRVLALLLPAAITASAHAQFQFPSIGNIVRESPAAVSAGDVVTYRFTFTPGTMPLQTVRFHFVAEKNNRLRTIIATDAALGRASTIMDANWVNDSYKLIAISLKDDWGRVVSYGNEGSVGASGSSATQQKQTYYAGTTTHAIDFNEFGFTLSGAAAIPARTDLTDIVAVTTTSVGPGQTLRLRTTGVPGAVPLARITFYAGHTTVPFGYTFTTDADTPNGEWSFPIPSAMVNGRYRLSSIVTTDREGRSASYAFISSSEGVDGYNHGIAVEPGIKYLSEVTFAVEGASATVPALAQLSTWERSGPVDVIPGSVQQFTFGTQTSGLPVQSISMWLSGPYGCSRTLDIDATAGTFSLPVTSSWINGSYSVAAIVLTDTAGRHFSYLPMGGSPALLGPFGSVAAFPQDRFVFNVRGGQDVGPYFVTQPAAETIVPATGGSVLLYASAAAPGAVTFQWFRGEVGDTSRPLTADPLTSSQLAAYLTQLTASVTGPATFWVRAVTAGSVLYSQPARVVPRPADYGRLTNVSILTSLSDASDSFTLGCVAGGDATSGSRSVVVRAAGPSLGALGVGGALADPKLQLYRGSTLVAENDDWGGTPTLSGAMAAVGAFAYASPASRDAAALSTFAAGANNSVKISGTGAGCVIAEIYDAGPSPVAAPTAPRLLNLSVLKQLDGGLTVGFAISGSSPAKILVRAVGPTLANAPFNVANAARDPRLALFRGGTRIALNDNWAWNGGYEVDNASSSVGAFHLDSASKDAALLATLAPGTYTAQVNANGASGVVLVEVYAVP